MALAALVAISLILFSFSLKITALTQAHCLPHQRHALIQLKQGFNTTELHSWNASTDCCIWDGITCDGQTGMVTALNLAKRSISGKLNPALFNLSSLQYLDLSSNYFLNITLPQTGFERLANLTHLDLSDSGFVGQVPISFSALTNLISLNLSTDYYVTNTLYLHGTGLKTILRNLTKLQVLRLDMVDISLDGSEWSSAVFQVGPVIQEISLLGCGLSGNFPDDIFHLNNLTVLDLSDNSMLSGQLPEFTKQSLLQHLDLSFTNFTGALPDSIGNLQYLLELGFAYCNLYGDVPPSITNLTRLEYLYLDSNRLIGTIPMDLFFLPFLITLDLSHNQLSGHLPEFLNDSSILGYMYLQYNNFEGQLSISKYIKNNKYIDCLDLSKNKLSIIEGENNNESFYASFGQLYYLGLASCNLIDFPNFLRYQTYLTILDLSNNSLTGEIPLFLSNMTSLEVLDLSYNNLTGTIPPWLLEHAELTELNLKSNKLSGSLPQNISQACKLETIILSENVINGSLPNLLMYCNSLSILDLGNNRIVNRFPYWLGNLENLVVLVLNSNIFYGKISDVEIKTKGNYSFFPILKVLDLSSNHFSGTLPKNIFVNLMAMKFDRKVSYNAYYFAPSITYKGLSYELDYMTLRIFSYIDISNNEFWGRIPEEIGQLNGLDVLNLSHNALTGSIPVEFAHFQQLQILDLSSNQLSGHIPQELTSLTFLSALNLSYNNLVGEIPEARQFSTFSNTSYMGNPELCGRPLMMQCVTTSSNHELNHEFNTGSLKFSTETIGLSVSIGLGLGVGFATVIWTMISYENGRKWFNLIVDRFYFRYFH